MYKFKRQIMFLMAPFAMLLVLSACITDAHSKKTAVVKPSIILIHGAFADGSSWQGVIPLLQSAGYKATALQLPLTSYAEDLAETKRVIDAQEGPVVLVGHSYGGVLISDAAWGNKKVQSLVFIDAFAPDSGEIVGALANKFGKAPLGDALIPDAAGKLYVDRAKFHDIFAQDLPVKQSDILAAEQKPIAGASFGISIKFPAWKTIPSWFLVGTEDNAISPELQRFMAKRMNAHTTEVKSSHVSSLVANPNNVFKIIDEAATNP